MQSTSNGWGKKNRIKTVCFSTQPTPTELVLFYFLLKYGESQHRKIKRAEIHFLNPQVQIPERYLNPSVLIFGHPRGFYEQQVRENLDLATVLAKELAITDPLYWCLVNDAREVYDQESLGYFITERIKKLKIFEKKPEKMVRQLWEETKEEIEKQIDWYEEGKKIFREEVKIRKIFVGQRELSVAYISSFPRNIFLQTIAHQVERLPILLHFFEANEYKPRSAAENRAARSYSRRKITISFRKPRKELLIDLKSRLNFKEKSQQETIWLLFGENAIALGPYRHTYLSIDQIIETIEECFNQNGQAMEAMAPPKTETIGCF